MGRGAGEQQSGGTPPPARRRHQLRAPRGPRRWTDAAIETELRRLVAENGGSIPTAVRLEHLGLSGLKDAMAKRGINYWSERIGVKLRPGQDRSSYGIKEAIPDIAKVLTEFGYVPGSNKLRELGYNRLAGFVVKNGGVNKMRDKYKIRLPSPPSDRD